MLAHLRTLYAYNAWANARILDTAALVPEARYLERPDGLDSLRDTLVHIAAAQWVWLQRWQGVSPERLWDPAEFPDVAALRARWREVEAATQHYLETLDEAALAREVDYVNFQGLAWAYPLWQQMLHQANHATQHRSEAALLLTRAGASPGWLDFLVFLDERAATA